MLKQFIQLFAETFLINKKEWISGFSRIDWPAYTNLTVSNLPVFSDNPSFRVYYPPSDGVMCFVGTNTDVYMDLQPKAVFGFKCHGLNSIIVPVKKGEVVYVYDTTSAGLRFVPYFS